VQKNKRNLTLSGEGLLGTVIIYIIIIFSAVITLYPFVYVLSNSFSAPTEVVKRSVILLPKKFTLDNYKELFKESEIWLAYYNTVWYTVVGTALNIVLTTMGAYALSVRRFFMRKQVSLLIVITMFVSGGIIPLYIIVNRLGLYNTRWALIFPTAINAYNLIVARSFFESIPDAMAESAYIDGANDITVLIKIIVPVSRAILAVLIIFYAVGHWNEYFNALIYISERSLKPIQIYLRDILIVNTYNAQTQVAYGNEKSLQFEALKFSCVIIMVLPITVIYPFFQKHFVKGVMIGAIKS
jgi:putative aldouronate transport system permease protein